MLKRLKLHKFRYIKPGTELMFTEHFNVLLGRNGTGKTTLLDLISMVLRSDFSALREEEFNIEYEFSHEQGSVRACFENKVKQTPSRGKFRQHHPRVVVEFQVNRPGDDQKYEAEVDGATLRWRQGNEAWEAVESFDVFQPESLPLLAETLPLDGDQASDLLPILDDLFVSLAYRFDESLGLFEGITNDILLEALKSGRVPAFVPPKYGAHPEPGKLSTGVDLPPSSHLVKFAGLAGIKDMAMSLSIERLDGSSWLWGAAGFLFTSTGGAVFNHNGLSYGQKRLLSFLYYLDANPRFVVADELVNGMHHDWIRACLDEIGGRQAFLTSQNPLLLDYLPLESVEQVQKSFIQCRVDDTKQIVWSNLAAEDAEELFADYKVGIQQVGEILRARGLW